MENFCPSSEGWGPLSSERPINFTTCFLHGALISGLNAIFVIAVAINLHKLQKKKHLLPMQYADRLFWFKLTTSFIVLFASISELVAMINLYSYVSVYTISSVSQLVAVAAAVYYQFKEQPHRSTASTLLMLYWLGFALLSMLRLRIATTLNYVESHSTLVISNLISILAALVTTVLESQSLQDSLHDNYDSDLEENNTSNALNSENSYNAHPSCEEHANNSLQSKFKCTTPLFAKRSNRALDLEDALRLAQQCNSRIASTKLQQGWQTELTSEEPALLCANVRTYGSI
ncbi:hypothetical protein COEREDRAFT_89341 [Coemansia reversa NRRL 1564]|uniref:ABC transporter TMD0 domain-containing protein n=1 Tax=Coemansia reversa (strain ATCC 12441 / NRRL 1564) TaxID=763665 RepID=A0A2G5B3W5_COERN|nr:hypothetical protein COEREDRAFT_89341 [Coemansia reversa NRRL 1564]|eukprot:PIA13700.1 hypothetical protein COEREDRAFT_89341 [Coemansia reversa NRRL 1564]